MHCLALLSGRPAPVRQAVTFPEPVQPEEQRACRGKYSDDAEDYRQAGPGLACFLAQPDEVDECSEPFRCREKQQDLQDTRTPWPGDTQQAGGKKTEYCRERLTGALKMGGTQQKTDEQGEKAKGMHGSAETSRFQ